MTSSIFRRVLVRKPIGPRCGFQLLPAPIANIWERFPHQQTSSVPKTDGIDFPSGVWQNESQWEYSALVIKKTEQQSSLVRPQCHLTAQLRDSGEHTRAQVIVARRHGPSGESSQCGASVAFIVGLATIEITNLESLEVYQGLVEIRLD